MVTAIDSSVLLDVLLDDPNYGRNSKAALQTARAEGALIICETVLAEVAPALSEEDMCRFLSDCPLGFVASSQDSALMAGDMFRRYLERGGKRGRILADFIIGAHAQLHSSRLLARDRGYFRDYFRNLKLWDPSKA